AGVELRIFFFSSGRRHTSWPRDWSSDVCSSDLSTGSADTDPAFTTTVAVWVTPIPSIVAEIVLDSASVDDSVPVATPLAFVVAEIGRASCRKECRDRRPAAA